MGKFCFRRSLFIALLGVLANATQAASTSSKSACATGQECLFKNWYITGAIGSAKNGLSSSDVTSSAQQAGFEVFDVNVDSQRSALKIAVGTSLTERFALEVGYTDLGDVSAAFSTRTGNPDNFFRLTNNIHPTSTSGVSVSTLYQFLSHTDWHVHARLGLYLWQGDYASFDVTGNQALENTSDADGTDIYLGLGANYKLTEHTHITLEWERYEFDQDNTNSVFVGASYRF